MLHIACFDLTLWFQAYANLKQRARKAYSDRLNYIRGTGGGEEPDLAGMGISDVYMKCLSICGTVTASGNLSVPNALQVMFALSYAHSNLCDTSVKN